MGQCAACLRSRHSGKVTAQEAPRPSTSATATTLVYTSLAPQAGQPWKLASQKQARVPPCTRTDRRTHRRTDTRTDTGLPIRQKGCPTPPSSQVGSSSPCPSRLRQMCAAKVMGLFKKCLSKEPKPVVYVPNAVSSPDYQREMALRQQQYNALTDHANINLPPSIPISVDGEEGYPVSQQRLLLAERISETESVRAPPNRTIYDGESPPPYQRSQSVGLLDRHSGKRNNSGSPSEVPRCYSMSSPNRQYSNLGPGHHHNGTGMPPCVGGTHYGPPRVPDGYGGSGTRTSLPPPRGHSRSASSTSSSCGSAPGSLGPPPNYSDIITNLDVFNKHSDSNV